LQGVEQNICDNCSTVLQRFGQLAAFLVGMCKRYCNIMCSVTVIITENVQQLGILHKPCYHLLFIST